MNHLGNFLKQKLTEMNMSERELSTYCGISHSYLNQLIKGKNPRTNKPISPTLETIKKLSNGLKIPITRLQSIAYGFHAEGGTGGSKHFLEHLEENGAHKSGIPVGLDGQKIVPVEMLEQIKEAEKFLNSIGANPYEHSEKEWAELMDDLQLIVKLHMEKRRSKCGKGV